MIHFVVSYILTHLSFMQHYLVAGNNDQPHMQLCVSGEELSQMQEKCHHYSANMDLLAAQLQVRQEWQMH